MEAEKVKCPFCGGLLDDENHKRDMCRPYAICIEFIGKMFLSWNGKGGNVNRQAINA